MIFHIKLSGENIIEKILKMTEKLELDPKKLLGLATDCAPAMVKKRKGFAKVFGSIWILKCFIESLYYSSRKFM